TVTIPCGFLAAWAADHIGTRRLWLAGAAALQLLALLGVLLAPGGGWLWAALLGLAIGPLFPLTMTLPLDAAGRPAEVAALAGSGATCSCVRPPKAMAASSPRAAAAMARLGDAVSPASRPGP